MVFRVTFRGRLAHRGYRAIARWALPLGAPLRHGSFNSQSLCLMISKVFNVWNARTQQIGRRGTPQ